MHEIIKGYACLPVGILPAMMIMDSNTLKLQTPLFFYKLSWSWFLLRAIEKSLKHNVKMY